jgi:hypothetical protein
MADDSDTKKLLGRVADELEEHGKRVGSLLYRAQKQFEEDYAKYTAVAGSAFIVASIVLSFYGRSDAFCITIAVIGVLLFIVGLVLRHFAISEQLKQVQTLLELERQSSRAARDAEIFRDWSYNGIPTEDSLARLLPLVSDPAKLLRANAVARDDAQADDPKEIQTSSRRLEEGEAGA